MANILETIADSTRARVSASKEAISGSRMMDLAYESGKGDFSFEKALKEEGMSFICECKKASPSKGIIAEDFPYLDIAKSYEEAMAKKEEIQKGIWYYMEPIFMMDHFDFCGIEDFPTTMEDFYFNLIDMVNRNSK